MKVLVVGSGGREHAIVRALLRSAERREVMCTPGNAGIAQEVRCLSIAAEDLQGLCDASREKHVDLAVIGPEAPLVAGVVDDLRDCGIAVFGPHAAAARLEGSKAFAKEIMEAAGVPTAGWRRVTAVEEGMAAIGRYPVVVKADGLAAGKGVVIAADEAQARTALTDMLERRVFGAPYVCVAECLDGAELSLLVLRCCEGEIPLAHCQV